MPLNTQDGKPGDTMKNTIMLSCWTVLTDTFAHSRSAPPIPGSRASCGRHFSSCLLSERRRGSAQSPGGVKPGLRAAFCAACLFLPGLLAAQDFTLDWFAVAAGGGESSGGDFELSATVGQPDAGDMDGGDFALSGGFWSIVTVVETPVDISLTLSLAGGSVIISWPESGSAGVALEETVVLMNSSGNTAWTTVNVTPQASNGTKSLRLPLTAGNHFYRLHKP